MIWRRNTPPTVETDKPKGFDDFELRLGDVMRGERATLGKSLLDVQRELRIKATYIAAIENCDLTAFESQSFVAGYVRSYARYLGMDPDDSFRRFCKEANFEVAHGMSAAATPQTLTAARARAAAADHRGDPLANPNAIFLPRPESWLSRIEPGAIGSVAVLITLIGALGYGGWSVLREVQRVQLAPADEAPGVMAELDPLLGMQPGPLPAADQQQIAAHDPAPQPGSPELMNRLRRPQALDVPVLVSRDGPIATIDPGQTGSYAGLGPRLGVPARDAEAVQLALAGAMQGPVQDSGTAAAQTSDQIRVVADASPGVELLAVRPAWVRVSSADGSVLFEKILDAGERYAVPALEAAPLLRSGNSGSVYFVINGQPYGPAAPGPQVVKNVQLTEGALKEKYNMASLEDDDALARVVSVADASAVTRQ